MDATGWSSGYATDHTYTTEFYHEQGPTHLNAACVVHGVEPVPLDRPFTCLELGCGQGLTALLLAASNPNGRFYANDFMPAHVATAEQLAAASSLGNLTMLENSFEGLARGEVDLPQFDFITMHGVYTWVSRENRRHIVDILARYLKPGGIVYVSYNALPGWAPALALQRLLLSQSAAQAGQDSAERLVKARGFVDQLIAAGAQYFDANPALRENLEILRIGNPAYLVHEYLHSGWEPMYHADVAADLAAAKLEFVGSTLLCAPQQTLPEPQQRLLDGVADPAWRETLRDFLLNTRFRKDIFVRGRRTLPAARRDAWLRQGLLSLIVPRDKAVFGFEWGTEPERVAGEALLDALAQAPMSLDAWAGQPVFGGVSELARSVAMLMADTRTAAICRPERLGLDHAAALRLNRAIAAGSREVDQFPGLASPVTGNGIRADLIERLVYIDLVEHPQDSAAAAVSARVREVLQRQPGGVSDPSALDARVAQVLATSLPMWRRLRAI